MNNKKGKNKIIIALMIAILVAFIGIICLYLLNNNGKKEKETKEEVIEEDDGLAKIHFYSDDKSNVYVKSSDGTLISGFVNASANIDSTYYCKIECVLFNNETFISYVMQNKKVLFLDGNLLILYDVVNGDEKILGEYSEIGWLYDFDNKEDGNDGKYLKVFDNASGMYGIIDKEGNIIHEFNLSVQQRTGIGKPYHYYANRYSIKDDLIIDYKNDKFGIVRITSNDLVVDYLYDDIELIDSKSYKAKLNGEWNEYNY